MDSKSVRRLAPTALYALLVSFVRNNLLSFYLLHHRVNTRWSVRLNLVRLTSIEPYYGCGSHFPLTSFRITAVTLLSCTAYVRCSSCHCITFLADSRMKVASVLDHDQQRCLRRGVVTSRESFFIAWVGLHWLCTAYQPSPLHNCTVWRLESNSHVDSGSTKRFEKISHWTVHTVQYRIFRKYSGHRSTTFRLVNTVTKWLSTIYNMKQSTTWRSCETIKQAAALSPYKYLQYISKLLFGPVQEYLFYGRKGFEDFLNQLFGNWSCETFESFG